MMSLTVLVRTFSLLPSPPSFLLSSSLSASLITSEKAWEWQEGGELEDKEEERRGEAARKEFPEIFTPHHCLYDSRYVLCSGDLDITAMSAHPSRNHRRENG